MTTLTGGKTMNTDSQEPLALSELRRWMSDDTAAWIQKGDEKQKELEKELEENSAYNVANLFGSEFDGEFEAAGKPPMRVQHWSSSSIYIDGAGGFEATSDADEKGQQKDEQMHVKLIFILSESYEGFGDTLWSSARFIANKLANPSQCRDILSPYLLRRGDSADDTTNPLLGTSFLEVGAGAGVPSWSAMHCGARVVCTDLSDTNRIRSMGECAERNYCLMTQQTADSDLLENAKKTRVCPHDWGTEIDPVARALDGTGKERFDVIIAADCCYMPWTHHELLDSIHLLLSDIGVCIICFALHGNTEDEDVWKIVDRAKEKKFIVEVLPSAQLTPPTSVMQAKQGLVHTVRLCKPQ